MHGLIASWFLTCFVHEISDLFECVKMLDFEVENDLNSNISIYIAAAVKIQF